MTSTRDFADAQIATPLHFILLHEAERAAARSRAAAGDETNDEFGSSCAAVLLAAASVETGAHWAAFQISDDLLGLVQDLSIPDKWQAVVGTYEEAPPTLGMGLGKRVGLLAGDRNRIAHNPSRGHSFFGPPEPTANNRSAIRGRFTSRRSGEVVAVASAALRRLGLTE